MAATRMYGNLSNDEDWRMDWTTIADDHQPPRHKAAAGWSRFKMNTVGHQDSDAHSIVTVGAAGATAMLPVLQSDQVAKIGKMKIKAVHMRSTHTVSGQLYRPSSAHGLSITRELAFGKRAADVKRREVSWEDRFAARVPEWACLGRMALMGVVFALVCLVYVLKLMQHDLETRIKRSDGGGVWNSTLVSHLRL